MGENQMRILQMVADGKISAEEAERLLQLIGKESSNAGPAAGREERTERKSAAESNVYTGFRRLDIRAAVEVDVIQGQQYSVDIVDAGPGDVNIQQEGETLKISRPSFLGFGWWGTWGDRPRVRITMPDMTAVSVQSASQCSIKGFHTDGAIELKATGASQLKLNDMVTGSLQAAVIGASVIKGDIIIRDTGHFNVNGAGIVKLAGSAGQATLKLNGAAIAKLDDFVINRADIYAVGASQMKANIKDNLDVTLIGASNLKYQGNPRVGRNEVTGGSHLRSVDS